MNKHALRSLTLAAALSLAFAGTAAAGTINFSAGWTGLNNTNLGPSYQFPGTGLTAYALVPGGTVGDWINTGSCANTTSSPCLFYKYTAGDPTETGLGLVPDPSGNNEIYYPNGIGLMTSAGYISGLELGSVQNGESWQVLGCTNDAGCTSLLGAGVGGTSGSTVTLTGFGNVGYWGYVVDVPCPGSDSSCNPGTSTTGTMTDQSNNIVLMSVTTVPEPGTLALFAAGLLGGALFLVRRRRAARQS